MKTLLKTITVSLAVVIITLLPQATQAAPVTASMWQADNIISDAIFTNTKTMSVNDIQSFLKQLLPHCDRYGNKRSEWGGGTRAQFAKNKYGVNVPFTCITEYYEVPKTNPGPGIPVNNYGKYNSNGTPHIPPGAKSAAQIIYDAAQKHQISARTIIIKLATESVGPLTYDEWPMPNQYYYAMGAHCPDSGANNAANCDSNYAGLSLQIDEGAAMLRRYLNSMDQPWWPYKRVGPGRVVNGSNSNYVGWHVPSRNCGGTVINIKTKATAALYTYTPYQPNQAALNNMFGTGDYCSTYGNRNFWRQWNVWFGPTIDRFVSLDTPRWMRTLHTTNKINPYSGEVSGNSISSGTHLFFADKIFVNGEWYLRTAFDKENNITRGVKLSSIRDFDYENFEDPRFMMLKRNSNKINPASKQIVKDFPLGTYVKFDSKVYINGKWYFRTAFDSTNGNPYGFPSESVSDISFSPLDTPIFMQVPKGSSFIDLRYSRHGLMTTQTADYLIADKVFLNGAWYYRTQQDAREGKVFATAGAKDIQPSTVATPYFIRIQNNSTQKYIVRSGERSSLNPVQAGTTAKIVSVITVNGQIYYQTEYDINNNSGTTGLRASDVAIVGISFIPLETPRHISLKQEAIKIDLLSGNHIGQTLQAGRSLKFTTKTQIGESWYLRTEYDTEHGLPFGIPLELLAH